MIRELEHVLDTYATGGISRRQAAAALAAVAVSALAVPRGGSGAESRQATFHATGLNHLGLRVSDVARSRDFYRQHLGMSVIRDGSPGMCFLRAGDHYMGLFRSGSPAVDHFCFTVEGYQADAAVASLERAGLTPRREEDRVYFGDPDGLEVQLDSRFGSWPGPPPGAG